LLYLPLYCSDFNPIEQAFAKLKALLRKTHPADALWTAIGSFQMTLTHPGYGRFMRKCSNLREDQV
jgi:transposase